MSFSNLSIEAHAYSSAFVVFCYIFSLAIAVVALQSSLKRKLVFASFAVIIPLIVIIYYYAEMSKYINYIDFPTPSSLSISLDTLPAYIYTIYALFVLLFSIFILISVINSNKNNLNRMSIKDGIDNLPQALMFFSTEGDVFLRNREMNRICSLFTKKPLQNANDFWNFITSPAALPLTVIEGNSPALRYGDEVWQFSKKEIVDDIGSYIQVKAINISERYFLSKQKAAANNKLIDRQLRIKMLIRSIEENAAAVATTNLLNNFHDSFGSMLALTKRILSDDSKDDEIKAISTEWESLSGMMTSYSQNSEPITTTLTTDNIVKFADRLDCTLHIQGEVSQSGEEQGLINHTIYEMIKNAVYHADAKEVFAEINDSQNELVLVVKNLCNPQISTNSPGGGINTINSMATSLGGHIEIKRDSYFTLTIVLPKNQSYKGVHR